ncbi:la-related protein 6B isoform X1 [Arachis duranensis]|uniref:La-related protein 6B isoform X1 n=1 Tax=Arachis duranensis TaxID=130453 RepID=A0A6P5M944_ARADU|nr:la-related protein 6B isoform X1 [Arachis duranensis]XP_025603270.1 la-related protein 6B isoform X1 [Arachis hypogaea]
MAQESLTEAPDMCPSSSHADPSLSRNLSSSRLNAQAPEFVPTRPTTRLVVPPPPPPPPPSGMVHVYPPPPTSPFHVQIQGHVPAVQNHHHHHLAHQHHHHVQAHYRSHHHPNQYHVGSDSGVPQVQQSHGESDHTPSSKSKLSEEASQKILNQVEYYFSDLNLATTDHLMRFINKDSEGFVPISVVASFKKIKALITSHSQLATALRNSTKLVVSEDGKKVKRQHPLTESDIEELQSRIVVAENLPEDHCHQNLMKVFSAVGSVKTIRTCPPQTSNSGASSASRLGKVDGVHLANKSFLFQLHAFVEYESVELAERAVAELNDERNWRSGLRVRQMVRCMPKPSQGRGKKGFDTEANCEEDYTSLPEQQANEKPVEDAPVADTHTHGHVEEHAYEKESGQRKGRSRGRGKGRGRVHSRVNNQLGTQTSNSNNSILTEQVVAKQPPGPRMPDGTRGFSMGRGKPIAVNIP